MQKRNPSYAFIRTALVACALSVATFATPIGPNLIVNGSFESGPATVNMVIGSGSTAITGWTTINSGVEYFQPAFWGMGPAQDGAFAVDLDNYTFPSGGLQQTFATVAGQAYQVEFWGSTLSGFGRDGTGNIQLLLAGILQNTFHLENHTGQFAWQNFTFDFTATDATTTLAFAANENPFLHFANLDNVVVGLAPGSGNQAAVPEPSSLFLMATATCLLALAYRKRVSPARR